MADGGREGPDGVRFESTFVEAAARHEPDARQRERDIHRCVRRRRRRLRRRRVRVALLSFRTASVVAGLAVAVLVSAGLSGSGPFRYLAEGGGADRVTELEALVDQARITDSTDLGPAATTTTFQYLERRVYKPGDCAWWDSRNTAAYSLDTKVVDCDKAHVLEVTGRHLVEDEKGPYPSGSYWDALFATGPCLALAQQYLGVPLDPNGNYYSHGVMPSPASWADGDREVYCGIGVTPYDAAQAAEPGHAATTGRVRATDQHRVYGIGSCVGEAGSGYDARWGVVPCEAPHLWEVTGHVDVTKRITQRPADDHWFDVVGPDCTRMAQAYAGANLRDPVRPAALSIEPGSWDAGRRTVLCAVAEYRAQEVVTITRRLGR